MFTRFSRCLDPVSIAQHWAKLELKWNLGRNYCKVFHTSPLNQGIHYIGRERLHHSYVAIVSAIVDKQVALCINSNELRRIKQVLTKRTVLETRLFANTSNSIDLARLNDESSHTIVPLVSDVSNTRLFSLLVLVVLKLRL